MIGIIFEQTLEIIFKIILTRISFFIQEYINWKSFIIPLLPKLPSIISPLMNYHLTYFTMLLFVINLYANTAR